MDYKSDAWFSVSYAHNLNTVAIQTLGHSYTQAAL